MALQTNSTLSFVNKGSGSTSDFTARIPKIVVVVDDERDIRLLYSLALNQAGHRVAASIASGDEVVRKFRNGELKGVDVIIMDYIMNGMSGLEAAMEIRRGNSKIKIFIVTGEDDVEKSIRAAGFGYRRKPLCMQDLLKCLK
jgi:DNA-binding response OmpR family regulator